MKVSELIKILETMPPDVKIVLCDYNRMAYEADGDLSDEGLYYNFDIDLDQEIFFNYEDEDRENPIPTVVISFETDYEEKENELREADKYAKELEDRLKVNN